jgi:hypothetical protein
MNPNNPDVQDTTRHRIKRKNQNYYISITESGIMFHAPNEGDLQFQDEYSAINTICRLVSKLRGMGTSWEDIVRQLDAGSMGNQNTWSALIVKVIRAEGYGMAETLTTDQVS